jgi:hypothetical protein
LKGLKAQGLSKAGKETLVKSVLQSVPGYAMSCFQLTKKQCQKLSSVSANFWWGDKDGQRKVHWIGWDRMCKNKKQGGMGYRDYESFNQAFLAKQGWRLLTDPDSLCARVLKARYFKNSDFLSASCPNRASTTWRGIIYGRKLLERGLIWRIGNGESVSIWDSNWIPRSYVQRPLGCLVQDKPKLVKELLVADGSGWDVSKLQQTLCVPDTLCESHWEIKRLQIHQRGTIQNRGCSLVRSAY